MLLPVLGAWVGTVLAFYFSRENYVAATENNAALLNLTLEQRLRRIRADGAMLPMGQVDALQTDKAEADLKLKDDILESGPIKQGRNRLLILTTQGVVRYIMHRSMVDKFITEKVTSGTVDIGSLTLQDLVDADDYKSWIISFVCVRPDETLGAVKEKMDRNPKCQDVIVTGDGSADKPAIGWITNVIVLEKSRA
jgi:hypothetical protein